MSTGVELVVKSKFPMRLMLRRRRAIRTLESRSEHIPQPDVVGGHSAISADREVYNSPDWLVEGRIVWVIRWGFAVDPRNSVAGLEPTGLA